MGLKCPLCSSADNLTCREFQKQSCGHFFQYYFYCNFSKRGLSLRHGLSLKDFYFNATLKAPPTQNIARQPVPKLPATTTYSPDSRSRRHDRQVTVILR